ncbi:MAG: HD domain-containing protein [Gammaproteobacteria bacterium]
MHDAAHVMAAYPGGISSIKQTVQWQDLIAQRYGGRDPEARSDEERSALFQALRYLHAEQARELASVEWTVPNGGPKLHLLEHVELREYCADLIGEIAASHHWPSHRVAEVFADRRVSPPAFMQPADWEVDALKLAFLLRTADAAHIDGLRAPWFLFALRRPEGISEDHWRFQAKLGQPKRTLGGELRVTSGSAFSHAERKAWWLAYDTVCMIDRELRDAHALMRDEGRPCFAATSVFGAETPEAFARQVPVRDWEPANAVPKIADVPKVIAALGGSTLYGDEPWIALQELLQNALDAVRALRALGYLGETEGEVEVRVDHADGCDWWLHVTDTGIGMSQHVLTNVLLDFGNSLWRSDLLRDELPGLAKTGFDAVGQFGIGFYSVFMLGSQVRVTTRRFERSERDDADQWLLTFEDGLQGRPMLARATGTDRLHRHGTQVSVKLAAERFARLFAPVVTDQRTNQSDTEVVFGLRSELLPALVGWLCPASEVAVYARFADAPRVAVIAPND